MFGVAFILFSWTRQWWVARSGHRIVKGEDGQCAEAIKEDRPVVDRTGVEGRYDTRVLWRLDGMTPERLAEIPPDQRPPDVDIFEAFEQQAGLRLEARRERIEVLVVDHIQPADEN